MGGFLHGKQRFDYSSLSDDRLATLAQGGDEVAFNVLASRYLKMNPKITKSSYLEAEDFVQEGMFGFLNAVKAFDPSRGVPFKSFASKCMSNSISSAVTAPVPEVLVDDEAQEAFSVDPNGDPLDLVIGSEELDRVLAECEVSLSKIEKTVIFFRASGMSYAEIGKKLGMTEKSVDNAVQRARKKLKSALTE